MIRIRGSKDYKEYKHALALNELILAEYPHISDSDKAQVHIFCPVRTPGRKRKETDLGLFAWFDEPILRRANGKSNYIHAIFALIEVKNNPNVEIDSDGRILVTQRDGSKDDVEEQSDAQWEALIERMRMESIPAPYLTHFGWLRQTPRSAIPDRYVNILSSEMTFGEFLDRLLLVADSKINLDRDGDPHLARLEPNVVKNAVEQLIFQPPETRLDRAKIDRLTSAKLSRVWHADVTEKQIIIEGRGGSGKTFALLERAVWWSEKGKRVLFLTYNHALASDIERQVMIMEDRGMKIQLDVKTLHSFLLGLTANWDFKLPSKGGMYQQNYESAMSFFLIELTRGRISRDSLRSFMKQNHDSYIYDLVLIDEGQDWLNSERDILHYMYDASSFIVAVGSDQLVRQEQVCDWAAAAPQMTRRPNVRLSSCVRMGSSLVQFVNEFARATGVNSWSVKESAELAGGKVIVYEGDFLAHHEVFDEAVSSMVSLNNKPIDMLVCVPPYIIHDKSRIQAGESLEIIESWGYQVWDGVDADMRKTVPWDEKQIRVVQYPSSRGLEGFTVVNIGMDQLYDWKRNTYGSGDASLSLPLPDDDRLSAASWCIIPLTRAMSSLVINVSSRNSELGQMLFELSQEIEGVTWRKL